jgi:aminoglycoside 6'-N-acetyltransferase
MTRVVKVLASAPGLRLRALEEEDVPLLARWRSDPKVLESYSALRGKVREKEVRREFLSRGRERTRDRATGRFLEYRACVVDLDGRPVVFVQYHRLRTSDAELVGYPRDERSYEMDLFIGDLTLRGKGLGTRIIALTRDYLHEKRGAVRIVSVPYAENERSIRAFEKAGFRRVRTLEGAYYGRPGEKGDGVLMEHP